jgi:hypothetical protein
MLKAAVITALMGNKSVDRTLRGMSENPGEPWEALAELLMRGMQGEVAGKVFSPTKTTKPPVM